MSLLTLTPVYSTSAPVYSVYPEGEGYRYGDVSSKTPDASLKSFGYPVVSSKSSKAPEYDAHPTPSAKTPEYDSYPVAHSSTPVYGNDYPASTAGAKSTPVHADYPVAPSSTPVYGNDYPAYSISSSKPVHNHYSASTPGVKSTPVYADYPELPSFTPLYSTYAAVSSKPSYGDDKKSTASYKTATAYETTYVDVCSTGYTTITTKVTAIQTPGLKPTGGAYYAPPGFEVTTKYCAQGCGEGPKTVTVTVPCSKCQASKPTNKASSVPSKPTGIPNKPTGNTPYTPAQPSKPVTPQGSTTKATATKIITLTKIPIPESQYYATHSSIASPSASLIKYPDSDSGKSYANSKPVAPTSAGYVGGDKPVYPTGSAPASKPVVPTGSAPASKPIAPTGSVGGGKPVYPTGSAPASKPVVPTGSAPASKPIAPTGSIGGGKPVYPTAGVPGTVGYPGSNVTISYGTATSAKGKPTQTASNVPEFTGAASSLRVGGVVAGAAIALAAMMM
ncbi:hypothetical protein SLS59_007663 [Nothophoma quercina]|uniref:Uncharacterized protein n=1 Tax=Nothophoma quercina TaxID=749835 RepID=A0ABR3QXM0_9PLEO